MIKIIHKIKGYLGYKVPIKAEKIHFIHHLIDGVVDNIDDYLTIDCVSLANDLVEGNIKLILRPLEDLTKKHTMELYGLLPITSYAKHVVIRYIQQYQDNLSKKALEYLHSNHIDYQDLIGQGLAIKKEQEYD